MRMVFVRLTRFAKTEGQCKNDLDMMLFIFKNAHILGKVPKSFKKTVFKRLFEIARISNFTDEELMDYESDMKRFSDHANALAYAKEKGVTQGITQGVMQTAKNMLKEGLKPTLVARITKLPKEQILALGKG